MELLPDTGESGSDVTADQVHHELAARLGADRDLRVLAVRYAGLDAVAHYYQRYATPDAFGDVTEQERRRFGRVLDDYYAYVDGLIGDALAMLRAGDLLLVVSGFGMEPLTPGKRLLERVAGNRQFSGTHERAPDGFLLAFGTGAAQGRLPRGALVDVTPTLLYFSISRSAATWTGSRGPICSPNRSTRSGRSRSFLLTIEWTPGKRGEGEGGRAVSGARQEVFRAESSSLLTGTAPSPFPKAVILIRTL